MANINTLVVVSLLLIPLTFHFVTADLDKEAPFKGLARKSIVVEGMVYCQSCTKLETSSLSEADPIPLARVSIICINHKNQVFYDEEHTANSDGYFYANLEGFSMDHSLLDHPLTSCKALLVSSPIEGCNIRTNINNGISGASLRYEHKRMITKDCDTVFYAAGPLGFRPGNCNTEDTHY